MSFAFRYGSFALILVFFLYALASDDSSQLLRYDKYPVFFTPFRLALTAVAFGMAFFCARRISGGFWGTLTPTNTFLLLFVFLVMPGLLLTPDTSPLGTTTFFYFWSAIIIFLISLLIIARFIGGLVPRPTYLQVYTKKSPEFIIFAVAYIVCFAMVIIDGRINDDVLVQLINFFQENAVDTYITERRQIGSAIGYQGVIVNYMMSLVLPLASGFFVINGLVGKRRSDIVIGSFMALLSVLGLLSLGGRLAALYALLFYFVSYSMVRKVKFSQVLMVGSVICWALILQTIALGRFAASANGRSAIEILILSLNRVVERIFLVKGYVSQQVVQYFPSGHDFLYGESYRAGVVGQANNSPSLAQEMAYFLFGGYDATAGPQAFGEGYANFGFTGMVIVAVALATLVAAATRFVARRIQHDAFRVVFLAYLTVLIARTGYGEFLTFKANGAHILALIYLIFWPFRRDNFGRPPLNQGHDERLGG